MCGCARLQVLPSDDVRGCLQHLQGVCVTSSMLAPPSEAAPAPAMLPPARFPLPSAVFSVIWTTAEACAVNEDMAEVSMDELLQAARALLQDGQPLPMEQLLALVTPASDADTAPTGADGDETAFFCAATAEAPSSDGADDAGLAAVVLPAMVPSSGAIAAVPPAVVAATAAAAKPAYRELPAGGSAGAGAQPKALAPAADSEAAALAMPASAQPVLPGRTHLQQAAAAKRRRSCSRERERGAACRMHQLLTCHAMAALCMVGPITSVAVA